MATLIESFRSKILNQLDQTKKSSAFAELFLFVYPYSFITVINLAGLSPIAICACGSDGSKYKLSPLCR